MAARIVWKRDLSGLPYSNESWLMRVLYCERAAEEREHDARRGAGEHERDAQGRSSCP